MLRRGMVGPMHGRTRAAFALVASLMLPAAKPAMAQAPARYRVQILAAEEETVARDVALRVHQALGREHGVLVGRWGRYVAVRVGDFASDSAAQPLLRELRRIGFGDAWIAKTDPEPTLLSLPAGRGTEAEAREPAPPGAWTAPPDSSQGDAGSRADGRPGEVVAKTPEGGTPATAAPAAAADSGAEAGPPGKNTGEVRPARDSNEAAAVSPSMGGGAPARSIRAIRAESPIRIDGHLDDETWRDAVFVADFQQKGKDRGFDPAERTEVAFASDGEALYVAARMFVHDRATMRAVVSRRDDPGNVERLLVSLDTYRDRSTAYTFGVTVGGARLDYYQARDDEGWKDDSFDPVWDARVTVDSAGWNAELRIPFSQLRFADSESAVWGLNVRRWNPATFLNVYWVVVPYYQTGWSSRFGTLTGLGRLKGARRIEVVPYAVTGATLPDATLRAAGAARESSIRAGGDIKIGLASNLTLDASINPDFGQVEADPADVNLSAYETFFPEKRPFFLEGRELFRSRGPNVFYSRRIGSVPTGTTPGGLDGPDNATILGAAKLTGRLPSGLSAGALAAVTAAEQVVVPGVGGAPDGAVRVAPATAFAVVRLNREVGSAGSNAGLIVTDVERTLDGSANLEQALTQRAFTALSDWNLRFGSGTYEASGWAGASHVEGSADAMSRVQTSSAHFYQRPDASHVSFDPTRTSLTGWTAGAALSKYGGSNWFWDANVRAQSPGFEIRDLGSQTSADRVDASGGVRFSQRGAKGLFQAWTIGLIAGAGWDFGGTRQYVSPGMYTDLTWLNMWRSYVQVTWSARAMSSSLTRGGPLMGTPSGFRVNGSLSSSLVPRTQWFANVAASTDELGGWSGGLDAGVSFLPGERLRLAINPGWSAANTARQYYGVVEGGPVATFGRRYVFATLDRTELYLQLRAAIAATPDLTIELYGEPFAANARYESFGELVAAGSHEVRLYGIYPGSSIRHEADGSLTVEDDDGSFNLPNGDFNIRSFRSNAVLRWEWRRGSTLFLIWQQNRWLYEERYDAIGAAALWDTIGDTGENILMAKLSYWLSF